MPSNQQNMHTFVYGAAMNISLLGGKKNIFAHMSKCSGETTKYTE